MLPLLLAILTAPYRATVERGGSLLNAMGWGRRGGWQLLRSERGAFTIPNEADAGVADQAEVDAVDLSILANQGAMTGVVSGCAVTRANDTQVTVAAGVVRIKGRRVAVAGGTLTIGGMATNPAYDLIYIDTAGDDLVLAGTEAAEPEFPTTGLYDGDGNLQVCLLAAVRVDESGPVLVAADIVDKRTFIADPGLENVKWYGAVGDGTANDYQAFQDAIDVAQRGIYAPPGDYAIANKLSVPSAGVFAPGFQILGAGDTVTRLFAHANWAPAQDDWGAFLIEGQNTATGGSPTRYFQLKDIMLGRNEATINPNEWRNNGRMDAGIAGLPLCGGIHLTNFDKLRLRNVRFHNLKGPAYSINGGQEDEFVNVEVEACGASIDDGYIGSSTTTTLTIANKAWTADCLIGSYAQAVGGTAHGEVREITGNTGNVITVGSAFSAAPTGEVSILEANGVASSTSTVVTPDAVTGRAWVTNQWKGYFCTIVAGTGRWQTRQITANNATTFTVGHAFDTTPDGTSEYVIHKPATMVYLDEVETGPHYAPAADYWTNHRWSHNRGPDFVTYTTKTDQHKPRYLSFEQVYGHSVLPPSAPGFWPFSNFYFEDARELKFGGGSIGRAGLTGAALGISPIMAGIHVANGKHDLDACIISTELILAGYESKNGTAYGVAFTVSGSATQQGIDCRPQFTQLDADAFNQLVYLDADADEVVRRAIVDVRATAAWIGKKIGLGAGAKLRYPPAARVTRASSGQTISDSTWTGISFDAERFDTDGIHDNASLNTRLTCQTPGLYKITGNVSWVGSTAGRRIARITVNGTASIARHETPPQSILGATIHVVETLYELAVGDFVQLEVFQSSGGDLNVFRDVDHSPEFMMALLAPMA